MWRSSFDYANKPANFKSLVIFAIDFALFGKRDRSKTSLTFGHYTLFFIISREHKIIFEFYSHNQMILVNILISIA